MKNKNGVLTILFILIVIVGGVLFVLFTNKNNNDKVNQTSTNNNKPAKDYVIPKYDTSNNVVHFNLTSSDDYTKYSKDFTLNNHKYSFVFKEKVNLEDAQQTIQPVDLVIDDKVIINVVNVNLGSDTFIDLYVSDKYYIIFNQNNSYNDAHLSIYNNDGVEIKDEAIDYLCGIKNDENGIKFKYINNLVDNNNSSNYLTILINLKSENFEYNLIETHSVIESENEIGNYCAIDF